MKKYISILFAITLIFSSCGTTRIADVTSLSMGMPQTEVNRVMGQPLRILSTKYYDDGVEETFEYQTYYYEAYAISFWNGRLSGYEFMYEIVPPSRPIYNRPHYPHNRPSQPDRPSQPNRPTEPSRPSRPTEPSRPSRPTEPSRPTTRPETKPDNGNSVTTSRPTYGQGNSRPTYNNNNNSNNEKTNSNSSQGVSRTRQE